jgi:hypothetical protein
MLGPFPRAPPPLKCWKPIRVIKHEAVPKCGSFEVRFPEVRKSQYFYWDDIPGRRLRPDLLTSEQALQEARTFARKELDRREAAG